jgi:hypothetical protein
MIAAISGAEVSLDVMRHCLSVLEPFVLFRDGVGQLAQVPSLLLGQKIDLQTQLAKLLSEVFLFQLGFLSRHLSPLSIWNCSFQFMPRHTAAAAFAAKMATARPEPPRGRSCPISTTAPYALHLNRSALE